MYAELLAHPRAEEAFVQRFLADTHVRVEFELDESIWRRAGQGFSGYAKRRRNSGGGEPRRLLVDFLVGAHAGGRAERLFTLDARMENLSLTLPEQKKLADFDALVRAALAFAYEHWDRYIGCGETRSLTRFVGNVFRLSIRQC